MEGLNRINSLIVALAAFLAFPCASGHKMASQQLTNQQQQLAVDLRPVTKNYLVEKFGEIGFGGKAFCAYKTLDLTTQGDHVNEYVYVVCQEYYLRNGELKQGTGEGLPVALELRKENDAYRVIGHRAPRDGTQYSRDVEEIFPKKTHDEILSAGLEYRSWKGEVEAEAKSFYGRN